VRQGAADPGRAVAPEWADPVSGPPSDPGAASVEVLRLRLELEQMRMELALWRAREPELARREADLAAENATLRDTRLAALNLIEDAVEARNRIAGANEALRVEAQARALAQSEALRERDLLRDVLESLPGIFYVIGANGRFLRWNRSFEAVSGYTGDEIAGMHPLDFFGDEADRVLIAARIARVFDQGYADAEAGFTAKAGSTTPYFFSGQRIVIGGAPCMVGMGIDISERRRTEAATQALEAQLREAQKMEAVGTLAGGVAHDFNNILASLLGNTVLALDALAPAHPARDCLDQIRRGALRARSLVQQILTFSRHNPPDLKTQPLRPLVEEALAMLRATLPAGVTLEAEFTDTPLCARVDATQFAQVLLNLCTNAWHALGGASGRIGVKLDTLQIEARGAASTTSPAPGRYARLTVSDSGCGMDEATRARIFEPFFTTKAVGSGTGLGLSVVHGIVNAHGGAITVASAPERGSVFTVLLPATEPPEPALGGLAVQAVSRAGRGEHVLYVDDDETVALVVGQLLQRAGFRTTCLADGASAIAALHADALGFDLVLTDYNMPGVSGLDVARSARALRPGLPVVVSSGHVDEALLQGAAELGVRGLLNKERTMEDMVALVSRLLDERSAP